MTAACLAMMDLFLLHPEDWLGLLEIARPSRRLVDVVKKK